MTQDDEAFRDSLMKQRAYTMRGSMMGVGQAAMPPGPEEYPRENRPMSPEANGFDYELRRLMTRARWGLSDAAVIEIMSLVISELHNQLEQANKG